MAKTPVTQGSIKGPKGDVGPSSWAGGVYSAGTITSGSWAPVPANGPEQEAILGADTTLSGPTTAGADGQKLQVALGATGASRVLTLASSLIRAAGYPSSIQIATTQQAWALFRYSTTFSRWTLIALPQEA